MKWLVVLAVAGCNELLDLDRTQLITDDRDDDGLIDQIDNCPEVANREQLDEDGDQIGDDCDACVQGSNHEEDGDGWLDGCDNCPHLANGDQANADGDDLGDLCDHDAAVPHTRARFDGFGTLTTEWIPGYVDWEAVDDSLRPTEQPPPNDYGLWSRAIEVTGTNWVIEVAVTPEPVDGMWSGMYTRQRIGAVEFACYLTRTNGVWALNATGTTIPLGELPSPTVRLRLRKTATELLCEIPDGPATPSILGDQRTSPGLWTNAMATRFHYVEAVSSPL